MNQHTSQKTPLRSLTCSLLSIGTLSGVGEPFLEQNIRYRCLVFCILTCNDRNAFFTSEKPKKYHAWSCQNVCDALTFLLDNIFIRFGTKLFRQVVGIPMGTNCAPLVADLFLVCYERDFMMSLSNDKHADVIDAFNTTSRYFKY